MRAEVIAIGDELTSGQRVDTNSAWISARLLEIGVPVLHHSTVGDDLDANIQVFRQAIDRADVIVATGGLGPTADDLTRDAVAAAVGAELELHQPSLEHIRNLFARRGSQMPESNQVQAMFPQGSNPIPNPEGTAPGIRMDVPRAGRNACRMVCLPGVPAEMKQMWEATAAGDLIATGGESKTIRHRVIKCFGAGESKLEGMLPDLIQRGRNPSVGITVHDATISLRITSMEDSEEACRAASASTERTIRDCLGDLVFGEESEELQDVVVEQLRRRGQTLSTVEGGAGGLIAYWLGGVEDAWDAYRGGMILPPNVAGLLRSPDLPEDLKRNPDPEAVVRTMAGQCRLRMESDYGLAADIPEASPTGETPQFIVAIAGPDGATCQRFDYVGHSAIRKSRAAKQALNALRKRLAESA